MILKAFIWISKHGPGGADVSDGPALRFALNARPTASQGEAPATAIGNMGRGQREESSAKGRRIADSQSNLPAFKKKRLHKILDKCCFFPEMRFDGGAAVPALGVVRDWQHSAT